MPANVNPLFTLTPNVGVTAVSATADAAVAASGSSITPTAGSFKTVLTAGTNGTRVEEIDIVGTGVTVAGLIRLYVYDGTSYWLRTTVIVPVVTPSATQPNYEYVLTFQNFVLGTGKSLVVTSTVASQLANVIALGGDF